MHLCCFSLPALLIALSHLVYSSELELKLLLEKDYERRLETHNASRREKRKG